MPVYNLCIKIIKKNIPTLLIYIIVFLGVSILVSSTAANQQKMGMNLLVISQILHSSVRKTPLIEGQDRLSNWRLLISGSKDACGSLFFRRSFTSCVYLKGLPKVHDRGRNIP